MINFKDRPGLWFHGERQLLRSTTPGAVFFTTLYKGFSSSLGVKHPATKLLNWRNCKIKKKHQTIPLGFSMIYELWMN